MSERSSELEAVIGTFRRWLHLPDEAPLLAVLGAVAANLLSGDPVWLLLVGPPGGGKSELLAALVGLPNVHPAATLTEAALLSGTPGREKATDAKGGLLRTIGSFGIVVCKDFGSVLSMNRDARAAVLAALREVYDGSWTRHVGTDGGRTLHWSGKVGLVAGCTPTIDRHHAVMGSMGERFVLFRIPEVDAREQARRALSHAGRESPMRTELGQAVAGLFAAGLHDTGTLDDDDSERLVSLATLVVRCRSAVERDGYTREVELIPEPEAPTRIVVVLSRFLAGLDAIGATRADGWRVVTKAALDSIPATRRAVIDALIATTEDAETSTIADTIGYPTTTTRRTLEDLAAHGIVDRNQKGKSDTWNLSAFARALYADAQTVPEKSSNTRSGRVKSQPDVSGTIETNGDPVAPEEIERLAIVSLKAQAQHREQAQ
jgi:hypothetical protein